MQCRGGFGLWVQLALVVAFGTLAPVPPQAQPLLAARVNGVGIPMDRLERQYDELLTERKLHVARLRNSAQVKSLKREALEQLIRVELLWQEAKTSGEVASDAEVEQSMSQVRGRFADAEAYLRGLEANGHDIESHRAKTRKLLSADRVAQRFAERDVQVSESDVDEFYALNARLFRRDEQVRVRQIRVASEAHAGTSAQEQARARAEVLLARARAGEDFESLARQHSDDATRPWGGELDPFGRGEKSGPIEDAAFALSPGEVSGLVQTAAGWHILKLEQRLPAAQVPLERAREAIREHLRKSRGREAIDRAVERLRGAARVEVFVPLQ